MMFPPRIAWATFAVAAIVAVPAALADDPPPYDLPPAPTPSFEVTPSPSSTPPPNVTTTTPTPTRPGFITPFPVVRIKGRLTDAGARITRLSVRAPNGTKVLVRCKKRGCPRRSAARTTGLVHFKQYERALRAGVQLEVTATKAALIGKYVLITIRRGKVPKRVDRCVMPGRKAPVTCPQA